eukprot:scaffold6092_cov105-Skeletonema_marinoi.AAC.4
MNSDFAFPAFESHGGRLEPFNDGHCPETFRCAQSATSAESGGTDESTTVSSCTDTARIVRYKCPTESDSVENEVHIYNDVLNPHHVQMLYEATASTKHDSNDIIDSTITTPCLELTGESPWGTYVTVEEALDWINWTKMNGKCNIDTTTYEDYLASWKDTLIEFYKWQEQHKSTLLSDEKKDERSFRATRTGDLLDRAKNRLEDMDTIRHALAVEAVAKFFIETIPSSSGDFVTSSQQDQSTNKELYAESGFLKQAHGVAVWALSSRPGASVQYHIDYAELLRYEYNVTVPPLWAGTIQCSALCNNDQITQDAESVNSTKRMVGGEFCVNLRGLEHYAEHGYKGMISGDPIGGWKSSDTATSGVHHVDSSTNWVTIPYTCNRGIVHNGDLPHLSAPIQHIDDDQLSRVIVGFNVFGHDVGARVAKAPEHSRKFRRQVKLYRTTLSAPKDNKSRSNGGMDLSQIRKNKGLTKLLVLAKRERVKEQLRRDQKQLTCNIWNHLLSHHGSAEKRHLCVGDIVEKCGIPNNESGWPTPVDAHVHLHNMLKQRDSTDDGGKYHDVDGIAGICGAYYKMIVVDDLESFTRGNLIAASTAISIIGCESDPV